MELNLIAFANADETAGDIATKRPENILHAVREIFGDFANFKINDHLRGILSRDRGRYIRRLGQDGVFHTTNIRVSRQGRTEASQAGGDGANLFEGFHFHFYSAITSGATI